MKKTFELIVASTAIILSVLSCQKTPECIPVTEVRLNKSETAVEAGKSESLKATVLPDNATDNTCKWSSSDEGIVTVDGNGVITGIRPGSATVTVTAGEKSADCDITVVERQIPAKSAKFDQQTINLPAGGFYQLVLTTDPLKVTEEVEWLSTDPSVATIDENATVTAVGAGTCNVRARFITSGVTASCYVTVTEVFSISKVDASEIVINDGMVPSSDDTLRVARGEVADMQIVAKANMPVSSLRPELEYFCRAGEEEKGILIEPSIYWEREIYCTRFWNKWEGGAPWNEILPSDRRFPDPLMPVDEWQVSLKKSGKARAWYEFSIPQNFEPGLYKGSVKVSGIYNNRDQVSMRKEFYVQVYPVNVPDIKDQTLHVVNWNGFNAEYLNNHEAVSPELEKELRIKQVQFMSGYRQNVYRVEWSLNWPDVSIVDGKMKLDYSGYLDQIQFYVDNCPYLKQIHGPAWCSQKDGEGNILCTVRYINDDGVLCSNTLPYTDERVHAFISECARQLGKELAARKLQNGRTWLESFAQGIFDEPWSENIKSWEGIASYIKEGCPEMKIIEPIQASGINPDLLDFPCPDIDQMEYDEYLPRGGQQMWIYTCLRPQGNMANRLFGMPLLHTRLVHWCNFNYNAIGYLHWGLCYWKKFNDPFNDDAYLKDSEMPGGDCFIIYPGYRKFYPSIRLCNMRDGIADYELLRQVEARNPAKARELCNMVVYEEPKPVSGADPGIRISGRFKFYNDNIRNFRNCRRQILEFLSE